MSDDVLSSAWVQGFIKDARNHRRGGVSIKHALSLGVSHEALRERLEEADKMFTIADGDNGMLRRELEQAQEHERELREVMERIANAKDNSTYVAPFHRLREWARQALAKEATSEPSTG